MLWRGETLEEKLKDLGGLEHSRETGPLHRGSGLLGDGWRIDRGEGRRQNSAENHTPFKPCLGSEKESVVLILF